MANAFSSHHLPKTPLPGGSFMGRGSDHVWSGQIALLKIAHICAA
jgi:hypothetical protein